MCAYAMPGCILMNDIYGVCAYTDSLQIHDPFEFTIGFMNKAGKICVDTKMVWIKYASCIEFVVLPEEGAS